MLKRIRCQRSIVTMRCLLLVSGILLFGSLAGGIVWYTNGLSDYYRGRKDFENRLFPELRSYLVETEQMSDLGFIGRFGSDLTSRTVTGSHMQEVRNRVLQNDIGVLLLGDRPTSAPVLCVYYDKITGEYSLFKLSKW